MDLVRGTEARNDRADVRSAPPDAPLQGTHRPKTPWMDASASWTRAPLLSPRPPAFGAKRDPRRAPPPPPPVLGTADSLVPLFASLIAVRFCLSLPAFLRASHFSKGADRPTAFPFVRPHCFSFFPFCPPFSSRPPAPSPLCHRHPRPAPLVGVLLALFSSSSRPIARRSFVRRRRRRRSFSRLSDSDRSRWGLASHLQMRPFSRLCRSACAAAFRLSSAPVGAPPFRIPVWQRLGGRERVCACVCARSRRRSARLQRRALRATFLCPPPAHGRACAQPSRSAASPLARRLASRFARPTSARAAARSPRGDALTSDRLGFVAPRRSLPCLPHLLSSLRRLPPPRRAARARAPARCGAGPPGLASAARRARIAPPRVIRRRSNSASRRTLGSDRR